MLITSLYFLNILQLLLGNNSFVNKKAGVSGVYVYKYYVKKPNSKELLKMFPDDSIFYHKGYGIEKITSTEDVIINDQFARYERTKEYYFIDFANDKFFNTDSLRQISHIVNPDWKAIHKKKLGIQVNYPYYNGEKYSIKDTVVKNKSFKLVRYINMGKDKGAIISFYLQSNSEGPILFSNIETKFQGRVRLIQSIYPNSQGEAVITINFYKTATNSFINRLIENTVNRIKKGN